MALGIASEELSRGGEGAMVADAGEDVENFALRGLRRSRRRWWQAEADAACGDFDGGLIAGLFFAAEVALQFDVDIVAAENFAELLGGGSGGIDVHPARGRARAGLRHLR